MASKKYTDYLLLAAAMVLFVVSEIPFIEDVRPVMYDEAWYANTAYNFAHGNGLYNTVVGSGANANFVAPVLMGSMMYVFGDSLLVIRLTAVLCGLLTLVILHFIMNQLQCKCRSRIITYGIFVSLTVINTIFRFGRPEFASLMFSALGIYACLCYWESPVWKHVILLSISAFLAVCSHPFATLLFALMGVWLLLSAIRQKQYARLPQLSVLLLFAVCALLLVQMLDRCYNTAALGKESSIFSRLFSSDMLTAIRTYLKSLFVGKGAVTTILCLLVIILSVCKTNNRAVRSLAVIALAFVAIFPVLFAADLNMIGLASDYLVLLAIVVTADLSRVLFDGEKPLTKTLQCAYAATLLYCLLNFGLTCYFNYGVKYEKTNTILAKEIDAIVPDSARVFGPLRQWSCKMHSTYYSELRGGYNRGSEYDYVITNSQDMLLTPEGFQGFQQQIELYEPVYTRNTKQYGEIVVYKRK